MIEQLKKKLSAPSQPPDYITFSGSGEPTLNSEIGWRLKEIKTLTEIDQEIMALLERSPCSLEDLSLAFGISLENLAGCLKELRNKGAVRYNIHNHTVFYRARSFGSESYEN